MYERGAREPSFEIEERIADFFNVDIATLRGNVVPEFIADDVDMDLLAGNLQHKIQALGKDVKTVASEIGIDSAVLSRWVYGKAFPNMNGLTLLANYFHCNIYELVLPLEDVLRAEGVSQEELDVIVCYRMSSPGIREAVDKLLNLEDYRKGNKR